MGNITLYSYDLLKLSALEFNSQLKKYQGRFHENSGDTIRTDGFSIKEYIESDRYTFRNMNFTKIRAEKLHLDNVAFENCIFSGIKLKDSTLQGIRGINKSTASNTITYDLLTRENSRVNKPDFLALLNDKQCLIRELKENSGE